MREVDARVGQPSPTWQRLSECPRCVVHRPNLIRTLLTALVVGVALFLINHLGPVLEGHVGTAVWVETGVSFVVPFCVANLGLLAASHQSGEKPSDGLVRPEAGGRLPTWRSAGEALACVASPRVLRRTVAIALVVGTIYFAVNQLDVVLHGDATAQAWMSGAVTYVVPFTVSNVGVLVASRRAEA
jgi:hypothetical protein